MKNSLPIIKTTRYCVGYGKAMTLSLLLFFNVFSLKAQNIYNEDFNLPDGTTSDNGSSAWTRSTSGGTFEVNNGRFMGSGIGNGEGVWTSEVLNISGFTSGVDISMDLSESGNLNNNDYIHVYYKRNGGSEVNFGSYANDFTSATVSKSGITGNTLQIVVRVKNNNTSKQHFFDNVLVKSSVNLPVYSTASGDWDEETSWSVASLGGATCYCYPANDTDVNIGNNNTINLNASEYANNITIENTGTLRYTADGIDLYVGAGKTFTLNNGGALDENNRTNALLVFQGNSGTSQLINNGGSFSIDEIVQSGSNTLEISGSGDINTTDIRLNSYGSITNNLTGDINVSGSLIYNYLFGSTFTNNGNVVINNDVYFVYLFNSLINNGTITVGGDVVNNYNWSSTTITNNADAILNIGDISLNNGNTTINNAGTINQSGNFVDGTIDTGSSFNNLDGGTWNWSYAGTDYDADLNSILDCTNGTNTFNYSASGTQNIIPVTYSNLTFSGSGTKDPQGNLDINGDLSIAGTATLNVGTYNVSLAGEWMNNGGTFTAGSAGQSVTFDGSGSQSISSPAGETFNHIIINKTSGTVSLLGEVLVNGDLTLTSGNVMLGDYNVTVGNTGSIVNGSATSFIVTDGNGQLIQNGLGTSQRTGNIYFPVGVNASSYTPLTINNSGTADNYGVKICDGIYDNGSCGGGTPASEDVVNRTWFIDEAVNGGSNVTLTFQWNTANELTGFDRSGLTVIHHNGSNWEEVGFDTAAGSGPYTATATGLTSFSPYGIKRTNAVTLPIELVSFQAQLMDHWVQIDWETASETDNDFFTVEKTVDLKNFEEVAVVKGKGTYGYATTYSIRDSKPNAGVSYYRLKQTDFNGRFTYSTIVAVNNNVIMRDVSLYPVPNNGEYVQVKISGMSEVADLSLTVFDITGTLVYKNHVSIANNQAYQIDFKEKLNPGIYMLHIGNHQTTIHKFVVR